MFDPKEPLWLPKGSVRSLLALGVVGASVAAVFVSDSAAERLLPLAGVAFVYYFEARNKGDG